MVQYVTDYPVGFYITQAAGTGPTGLGPTGGKQGDYIEAIVLSPSSTTITATTLKDGANAAFPILNGTTLADTSPFSIPLKIYSNNGAWQLTTRTPTTALLIVKFS